MSSEESKDCAYFLTFVFSVSVKISIMEKNISETIAYPGCIF